MTDKKRNDLFYVCSLIEYIGRKTKNKRKDIVERINKSGIEKLMHDAEMDHCLSFEQVSDEVIAEYGILTGNFDTVTDCKYSVPSYLDIGKLYSIMIEDLAEEKDEVPTLIKLFSSFISDEISNFQTGVYYQNPSYLECSYQEGYLMK